MQRPIECQKLGYFGTAKGGQWLHNAHCRCCKGKTIARFADALCRLCLEKIAEARRPHEAQAHR